MVRYDGARFAAFAASAQPRGNVTRVARWLGGTSYVYTYSRYDNAGNVVSVKDPTGHVSSVSYADNYGAGTNPDAGVAGTNGATFAFPTLQTNALGHQAKTQYSYNYDAPTGTKDPNGTITRTDYDTLGRPVRVTAAQGLAEEAVTETSYPTATVNAIHTSKKLDATRWVSSRTQFDGFGRPAVSSASEDGKHYATAAFSLHTKTVYDALGRPAQASNPYRTGQTPVYAATGYDLLGRVTSVTTPDAAKVLTVYDGEAVMVTDQAGEKRISRTDALGRLADVWEVTASDASTVAVTFGGVTYNGYRTAYRYDVLDNLRKVDQGGQLRFFAYDTLSRLVRAKNPEQGAMAADADFPALTDSTSGTANSQWSLGYKYDAGGNLVKRKDARGVVTTYGYDALNRNTAVSYSDATMGVGRAYDEAANGIGRLAWDWQCRDAQTCGTHTSYAYDAVGRVATRSQHFWANGDWGAPYSTSYSYDKAGNVTSQTYPRAAACLTRTTGRAAPLPSPARSATACSAPTRTASSTTNSAGYGRRSSAPPRPSTTSASTTCAASSTRCA
jgi:YD repeat-containing protein